MTKSVEERTELYKAFQERFPIEKLREMTLDEYSNLKKKDSFCFWIESKTDSLGSFWGGSSFKFGIYRYAKRPKDTRVISDGMYAWYKMYNLATAQEAFQHVRDTIYNIAVWAKNGAYEKIEKNNTLGNSYKWKIAFLYSDFKLVPIYKREYLNETAEANGIENAKKLPVAALQRMLMQNIGNGNPFDYYDELWNKRTKYVLELKTDKLKTMSIKFKEQIIPVAPGPQAQESYDDEKFLSEVFMTADQLKQLKGMLRQKQNIILQGAPGIGKTFTAKRLAYAMMGEKDDSRVKMVQFHQSYSYENFIMGYKPTSNGFALYEGVFYDFCRKASEDPERDYFFIIDEINRGNLSKIFGELLMLIEKSYRDESVQLAYRKEEFSVPGNLYIIGMMNTADRSLALIDYALRRRFGFINMHPGFDTEGFRNEIARHADPRINKAVSAVEKINAIIAHDDSLGEGFCIGHSYFCNQNPAAAWIENVVLYELIPMIEEYWFDNKDRRTAATTQLLEALK